MTINEIATMVHENAKAKGFHPSEPLEVFIANQCNNIHGEVQELWDAFRAGTEEEPCDKNTYISTGEQLTCKEEELADIIIRVLDVSKRLGVNIEKAILIKHQYNTTRPFKHGKKN